MRLKSILFVLFVLIDFLLLAQEGFITISGNVKSLKDSSAINLANISIEGQPIGTYTNEVGKFIFHVPDSLSGQDLVISSIGFHNYKIKVSEIKQHRLFLLKPHDYDLREIVVFPDSMEAKYIVKKAVRKISKNYPRKRFYLDAFYRGLAYNDTSYLRLVEAAIGIFDFGYDTNAERSRIKVLELRKSIDYVLYSQYKKLFEYFFGNTNILYDVYYSNPLRSSNERYITINNNFRKSFEFNLTDIIYLDDKLVYVISFIKTRYDGNDGIEGQLFINVEDYAFIKLTTAWFTKSPAGHRLRMFLYKEKYWYQNTVWFKKYNEKYYPSYIEHNSVLEDFSDLDVKFRDILLVNHIYTSKQEYEKIEKEYAEKKDIVLHEKSFKYNPEFWKNFNILLTNPVSFKVFKDLEKEKTLETQFKENSKQ